MYLLTITSPDATAVSESLPKLKAMAEIVGEGPLLWYPIAGSPNESDVLAHVGNEEYRIVTVAVID